MNSCLARRFLSLFLSLVMVLASVSAFAGDKKEPVKITDETAEKEVEVDGSVTVEDKESAAVNIDIDSDASASVEAKGDIESSVTETGTGQAAAVNISAHDEADITVKAGESIAASSESKNSDASGVYVDAGGNTSAKVEAGKGVSAETKGQNAVAVASDAVTNAKSDVTVKGDEGVRASAQGGDSFAAGTREIVSGKGAESSVSSGSGGISASASGTRSEAVGAFVNIDTAGSGKVDAGGGAVSASAKGTDSVSAGVDVSASDHGSGEKTHVDVSAGSVSAKAQGESSNASAISVETYGSNADVTVNVSGAVSASVSGEFADASGVTADAKGGSSITVSAGEISSTSAENDSVAIHAHTAGADSTVTVSSAGDVTVKGGSNPGVAPAAIGVENSGGEVNVTVGGSIVTENGEGISIDADLHQEDADDAGDATSTNTTVTVTGDITVESGQPSRAIRVTTGDGNDNVSVTVGGNVTVDDDYTGIAVDINGTGGGNTTVDIGGDLSHSAIISDSTALSVQGTVDASVKVGGGISASSSDSGTETGKWEDTTKAVDINVSGGSTVEVTGGSISASANEDGYGNAVAVSVATADEGDQVTVKADGDVSVSSGAYPSTSTTAVDVNNKGGKVDITITGSIATKNGEGISVDAGGSGESSTETAVTVEGDVTVESELPSRGLRLGTRGENDSVNVEVGGSVTVNDDWEGKAVDIYGPGTTDVDIGGDVSVTSKTGSATGVSINGIGSDASVKVGGGISAQGSGEEYSTAVGLDIGQYGGEGNISVAVMDGITADNLTIDYDAYGIRVENREDDNGAASIDIDVTGDIKSSGYGIEILASAEGKGTTEIEVKDGDVEGGTTGIHVFSNQETDIIVDGTVSGGSSAILLESTTSTDNLTMTVWKVKPGSDGNVVSRIDWDEEAGGAVTFRDEEAEKELQYIIKVQQPTAGATLSTEGTYDYKGYKVAKEDDIVILKIDLKKGYELVDAFWDEDQKATLLRDAGGNWYLAVPRGGGVLLSVKLKKIERVTASAGAASRVTAPVEAATVVIDPNGGSVAGSSEAYSISTFVGKWLDLPDAPVREGFEFLGWYGTPYAADDPAWKAPEEGSPDLLKEKTRFRVSGDIFYTAIWKDAK